MLKSICSIVVFLAGVAFILSREHVVSNYNQAMDEARRLAIAHIAKLQKGTMIIFDFDHTLFDPHSIQSLQHVGPRDFALGERSAIPIYKAIREICDVLKYACAAGMFVVVITARPTSTRTRQIIIENFRTQKMKVHALYTNDTFPTNDGFKKILREKLAILRPLGLTIGDQWHDVNNEQYYIKLPSRKDPRLHSQL